MSSFFGKSGKPILNRLSQSFSRQCTSGDAYHGDDGRLFLSGKINGVPVSVLVSTGAPQNVISERLAATAASDHELVLELGEDYRTNIKAQVKELGPGVDAIVGLPWHSGTRGKKYLLPEYERLIINSQLINQLD